MAPKSVYPIDVPDEAYDARRGKVSEDTGAG
jgi:hypothetical protein